MNSIVISRSFVLTLITSVAAAIHLASYDSGFAGYSREYLSYLKNGSFAAKLLIIFFITLPLLLLSNRLTKPAEPAKAELLLSLACLIPALFLAAFKYDRILTLSLNNMLFFSSILCFISPLLRKINPQESGRISDTVIFAATAFVLGLSAFYCTYSAHRAFNTATDIAIFANTIWLSANSLPAVTWLEGSLGTTDRLGVHFQPFIYLFTPFFKNTTPVWLLLLSQAAAVYCSAFFIYLLGRKIFTDKRAAFITGLAYLCSFFLIRSIDFDFHLTPFFALFFLAFLYFSEKNSFFRAAAFFILAASTREDSAIYLAAASVFFYLRSRNPVFILFSFLAAAYTAVINLFVMPSFSASGATHGARALSDFFSFFSSVKPAHLADFVVYYLLPFAFLPLIRISSAVLLLLPAAAVYLPASTYYNTLFFFHYHAMVLPGLFASFIFASEKFNKLPFKINPLTASLFVFFMQAAVHLSWAPAGGMTFGFIIALILLVIIPLSFSIFAGRFHTACLAATAVLTFFLGYYSFNGHRFAKKPVKEKAFTEISRIVPSDKNIPVIASVNLVSRFSARKYVSDPSYYTGSAETLANRVMRSQSNDVYLVTDTVGSYSFNAEKESDTLSRFIPLMQRNGFDSTIIYNSPVMTVIRISRDDRK